MPPSALTLFRVVERWQDQLRDPGGPGGGRWVKELGALADDDLLDLFVKLLRTDDPDADDLTEVGAELDRRERATMDKSQRERRLDELVAKGKDFRAAYAEAHDLSDDDLNRQDLSAELDARRQKGQTREQVARQMFHETTMLSMLRAEAWTGGNLLNRAAMAENARRARRNEVQIHPLDLFSGPAPRARKWAADELKQYWAEVEPRVTYAEFRVKALGRPSDRRAAARVKRANDRDYGL